MSSKSGSSSGISVTGLLGVAFIVLKLCHVIEWSWWWVLVPFWGTLAVLLLVVLVWGAVRLIAHGSLL